MVGERSYCSEAIPVRDGGAVRSENAGMSNEINVRNINAESPRFPFQC